MADQTSASTRIAADRGTIMGIIADFDGYPRWSSAVKEVEVRSTYPDGRAREVWFRIDSGPLKDAYTLAYEWDGDREVRWKLVQSKLLKRLDGSYALDEDGDATQVTYRLTADVNLPLIGVFRRRAEKVVIDTALTELGRRVTGGVGGPA